MDNAARYMGIWIAAGLLVLVPGLALLLVEWLDVTVPQSVGVGSAVVVGIGLILIIMASVGLAYSAAPAPAPARTRTRSACQKAACEP